MTTATTTTTLALNAAFFQEVKEDHQELWRLVACIQQLLHDDHQYKLSHRQLVDLSEQFRDQLALHFALEEAFGYFDDAVSCAPRLSIRAEQLRAEHHSLYLEACYLVEQAERLLHNEVPRDIARQVNTDFSGFLVLLQQHEDEENELIQRAFTIDIGVGD